MVNTSIKNINIDFVLKMKMCFFLKKCLKKMFGMDWGGWPLLISPPPPKCSLKIRHWYICTDKTGVVTVYPVTVIYYKFFFSSTLIRAYTCKHPCVHTNKVMTPLGIITYILNTRAPHTRRRYTISRGPCSMFYHLGVLFQNQWHLQCECVLCVLKLILYSTKYRQTSVQTRYYVVRPFCHV